MSVQTPLPTRVRAACDRCWKNKSRCDSYRPCSLCLRANTQCATTGRNASHGPERSVKRRRRDGNQDRGVSPPEDPTRYADSNDEHGEDLNAPQQDSQHDGDHTMSPVSGSRETAGMSSTAATSHLRTTLSRPSSTTYLLNGLPPETMLVAFLEEYFSSVHWFSLVIYEPSFRPAFDSVRRGHARSSQRPFLLLLSVVLGLGAWYRGQKSHCSESPSSEESKAWSAKLIANAESKIIEILDQSSVTAVQTLILLGSFFVYHGRPNLSFSLLGATVKSAHAAGLHKKSIGLSFAEDEERKRVWWTIYTWDRFASVTYGRPISIDERDCDVLMPGDIEVTIDFRNAATMVATPICFSAYQRELNKLYMIASPAIKQVYSARETIGPTQAQEYIALLDEVTARLWDWHQSLPGHLSLDLSQDCPADLRPAPKAHYLQSLSLQSLSLQLKFDSLLIVLHRPFQKRQLNMLQSHGLGGDHGLGVSGLQASGPQAVASSSQLSTNGATTLPQGDSSRHQWWKAAARTAKVVQLPQLAQFACDGHLVAFLAINLFNAAIVMVVLALSDPLADAAQEAKRAIARIYRLQGLLGARSSLSRQSLAVLRNLVVLLSRRESEAILNMTDPDVTHSSADHTTTDRSTSVRNALSMPLGGSSSRLAGSELQSLNTSAMQHLSRIDDGLASVQRAITIPNLDITHQNQNPSAVQEMDNIGAEDGMLAGLDDLSQFDLGAATVSSEWSTGRADARNGVYWFWDPTWDHLYGGDADPGASW